MSEPTAQELFEALYVCHDPACTAHHVNLETLPEAHFKEIPMHTETQWRVTGQPNPVLHKSGEVAVDFRPYDFTWTEAVAARHGNGKSAEEAARAFVTRMKGEWSDGPHLHKRYVTTTDWEQVDA